MADIFGSAVMPSMKERQKRLCQENLKARVNPVYKDTNNFGTRLLSKLGWKEGKGLGVREDGISNPILPKYKKDIEGFGYVGEKDDQWTQHDQSFNELLKNLNKSNNNSSNSNSGDEEINLKSLEEQSKKSRARVHYKKFTRGKDLTRASDKDLANIFGKKTLNEVTNEVKPLPKGIIYANGDVEAKEVKEAETNILGLTTIHSKVSVQDYFKAKMESRGIAASNANGKRKHEESNVVEAFATVENEVVVKKKSKKSKNKSKGDEPVLQMGVLHEENQNEEEIEILETLKNNKIENEEIVGKEAEETLVEEKSIKKKSKKSKKRESVPETVEKTQEECPEESVVELENIVQEKGIEKRKKKKNIVEEPEVVEEGQSKLASKKAKNPKNVSEQAEKVEEIMLDEEPRRKRSKKCKTCEECPVIEAIAENLLVEKTENRKKKKKEKSPEVEEFIEKAAEPEDPPKKSKKSKRKQEENKLEDSTEDALLRLINDQKGDPESAEVKLTEFKTLVFQQLDPNGFAGSNFGDIIGYGLTTDLKLVMKADTKYQAEQKMKLKFYKDKTSCSQKRQKQLRKKVTAFSTI